MKNISPNFDVWEIYISELEPGYKNITCHMIFDVKMGKNFRNKTVICCRWAQDYEPSCNDLLVMGIQGLISDCTDNSIAQ